MGNFGVERLSSHVYRLITDTRIGHSSAEPYRSGSYIVIDGVHAIAIGGEVSFEELSFLGIDRLDHIYLTHHHADEAGHIGTVPEGTMIHAPAGEARFLDVQDAITTLSREALLGKGCPESYNPPKLTSNRIVFDVAPNADHFWRGHRIRFVSTPGHTAAAISILIDIDDKCVVFCGDAIFDGGRLYEPYHVETDHWTGAGTLAAWEGIQRISGLQIDLMCPSHGPVIRRRIRSGLRHLSRRLMAFYKAKGQISPYEPDGYVPIDPYDRSVSAHLYRFGGNGYLITSENGEGFVVDPTIPDLEDLEVLVDRMGITITGCTATHYHADHIDGVPALQKKYGTQFIVHPEVIYPVWPARRYELLRAPWLPNEPIRPDILVDDDGEYTWNEYRLTMHHTPGQTWWHASIATQIDGSAILFSGDSFQPASRWNGTGGFCAYNRSRLKVGFQATCYTITRMAPDILAAGHGTIYSYQRSKLRRIARWAGRTEGAIRALCPSKDAHVDYYRWPCR